MIEFFAVIFTIISVYLSMKNNIHNWWTGIIAIGFYAVLFYQTGLYANLILQSVFMYQSIKGWYLWSDTKNKPAVQVESLTTNELHFYNSILLPIYFIILYFLINWFNPTAQLSDSITSALSLLANTLLMNRKLQTWYYWILADIIYVPLFISQSLYMSAGLYFIFLIMATKGLINWKKEYKLVDN